MDADSNDIKFDEDDLNDLRSAKAKLEYASLTSRISDIVGKPIEVGSKILPRNLNKKVAEITQATLLKGLELAVLTIGKSATKHSQNWLHKVLVAGSGVAGGAVGLASLPVELPISTALILRSVADIARSEGHDVSLLSVKLSCLEVLALGGKSTKDDAAETGYWVVRGALARSVSEAAAYIAKRGLAEEGAPPLIRLITAIASRFSIVVTEQVAAKAVPVIGAVAGGSINLLFMHHYQEMARGHFIVKRLEKKYGTKRVEKAYEELAI
jgi:hypothetical protein